MAFEEKVLVIDDSAIVLEMIERTIGDIVEVITASTGKAGLVKLLEHKPTLVLLDVKLPDIDGMKVCKAIKADNRTKHVPVLLITGEETDADAEAAAFATGAADFIRKPMHPAVVRARVKLQLELEMRAHALNAVNIELQRLASTDMLTGCLNRNYFINSADAELSRMKRHDFAVCVAILDLDHFKNVNDSFGHAAGDEVLRLAAACMKDAVRHEDTVGRLGGEEFAILLPVADAGGALIVLERLRERLSELRYQGTRPDYSVTTSIGLAEVYHRDLKIEDALQRADEALYRAKREGRNRICVANT
ncbi:GGDEF domain-containing response regulator [Kordiimonas aestuarii]|uniref:GGDEF domain-containing response regulator n=1 Tax=Kordiimonas aestuarii TaxID=1005925 RepID=UPI0021D27B3D|nr:diguanylate cyclase [Kordiimonas aestuarii]